MRFERTDRFAADYRNLSPERRELFRSVIPAFNAACDTWVQDRSASWPAALRVKPMKGAPGVWEMTWSFSGPAGRATFEWTQIDDGRGTHTVLRWRRIGTHDIYTSP